MSDRPGIFMDRDGVINRPPPPEERYITCPDDFQLQPGIAAAIRLFNERNLPVAVVTNQKSVAIGRVTLRELQRIHVRMRDLLAAEGATLQNIQFCPHQESDQCECRKPQPGMIRAAAEELNIDPRHSWMIGDQARDLEAGRAIGCKTLLIGSAAVPASLVDIHLHETSDLAKWIQENIPFQAER
ncbi:MAG: HAD family hydrolase [Kiritimatiellae bacterium]|nr:HAD family hydrolase [Kiritimatiellia bacterium]